MFCPNCGKDVGEGRFCEECGFDMLSEAKEPQAEKKPQPKVKKQKVKKPLTKERKIIIALGVLLFIGVVLFYKTGSKYASPVKAAKAYQTAYNHHDWETVYDLTAIDDTKYITKEVFVSAMKEKEASLSNLADPTYSTGVSSAMTESKVYFGTSGNKTFRIQDQKRFLFFSKWMATDFSDCIDVTSIQIPYLKDISVTIDGISIDANSIKEDTDAASKYYLIDNILEGTHTIKYSNPGGILDKTTYQMNTQDDTTLDLQYSSNAMENAKNTLVNSIRAMVPLLIKSGTTYKDIASYFVSDVKAQQFFSEKYEGDAKAGAKPDMTGFKYELDTDQTNTDGVKVSVSGSAAYDSGSFFTSSLGCYYDFTMAYENSAWLIRSW